MPASYPIWNPAAPHTNRDAAITRYRNVQNITAIEVQKGSYRGCQPFSGFFELVSPGTDPRMLWGSMRAEVYCAWHGVMPPSCHPKIIVGVNYVIHQNYCGEVVDNLA